MAFRKLSLDANANPRRYLRRFPSDSDLYRKVLNKKAMSHSNLRKTFASCVQLNKFAPQEQHQNCKVFKYEEKLTSELKKFYSLQVKGKWAQMKRNKSLAFSVVLKVLINAQVINDRFTVGEILCKGARYGDMIEKESYRFAFGVPVYFGDNETFFIHRAEEDGFVRLQLEECETWEDCVSSDRFLSASLVRSKLHLTFKSALRNLNSNIEQGIDEFPSGVETLDIFCEGSTIVMQINDGSLIVELIPTIPIPRTTSEWCRRFSAKSEPPSHVVARPCQLPMSDPETLWEMSFLSSEKRKFISLGTAKYRLFQCLSEIRERDKTVRELSLYQLQTVLFHAGDQINDALKWATETLGDRFLDVLRCLENFLERKHCPHYFIPNVNLFSCMNAVTISLVKDKVRRMLRPSCVACGVATICKTGQRNDSS